jgi:hypothetical protein
VDILLWLLVANNGYSIMVIGGYFIGVWLLYYKLLLDTPSYIIINY